MTDIKLIITGSMGAGKTTVVTAISEFPPVRTEVPVGADQVRGDKTTTTVALDYGAMTLEDGRRLLIFGTPGQRRFDFMCKILARGALGVVILIDHAGGDPAGDLTYYMDLFRETIAEAGAVIGVTHTDERPNALLQLYHDVLARQDMVLPVFSIDARRRDHIITMLEALIATIQWEATTVKPIQKRRLVAACQGILESLRARCTGLLWASVSTKDGIEIVSVGELANEKLSVMSGTMHALADGIVAEASLGACHDIILDAENGRIVILSVREGNDDLVLAGMASPETSLGLLLSLCTSACDDIGRLTFRQAREEAPQSTAA